MASAVEGGARNRYAQSGSVPSCRSAISSPAIGGGRDVTSFTRRAACTTRNSRTPDRSARSSVPIRLRQSAAVAANARTRATTAPTGPPTIAANGVHKRKKPNGTAIPSRALRRRAASSAGIESVARGGGCPSQVTTGSFVMRIGRMNTSSSAPYHPSSLPVKLICPLFLPIKPPQLTSDDPCWPTVPVLCRSGESELVSLLPDNRCPPSACL